MNNAAASHDGLPDAVASERLLAKKIKAGTATADECVEWVRITSGSRSNEIGVQACEIIQARIDELEEKLFLMHTIPNQPISGEHIMNINELPAIGSTVEGGIFAGITKAEGNQPQAFLILLDDKPAEKMTWDKSMEWAAALGNDARLSSLSESALLYANLKDQFEPYWHWTNETTQPSSGYASIQVFADGNQDGYGKDTRYRARAVRRLSVI